MESSLSNQVLAAISGFLLFMGGTLLLGQSRHAAAARGAAAVRLASPDTIVHYVRDRFQVPETTTMAAEPLHDSSFPAFYQTTVTSNDGKETRTNTVYITKDGQCFVAGKVFALEGGSDPEVLRAVREAAKAPPATQVSVGPFSASAFPEFLKSTVTADDGKNKETGEFFVTADRRTGILGIVLPFTREAVEHLMAMTDQPSVGPKNASVSVVEYADLQCPSCALFHKFLENQFLPQYGDKVRIVFKEFPLAIHDWSKVAAIANECAYQIDAPVFLQYRTLIFSHQDAITAGSVRSQMLSLGQDAGLDRMKLADCIDSSASLPRIEANQREVEDLGLNQTPTSFVNGRIVVGAPPADVFDKIVDEALAATKSAGVEGSSKLSSR